MQSQAVTTHPSNLRPTHRPPPVRFPPQPALLERASFPAASDAFFIAMLGAYRASGGLARAAEVVTRVERGRGLDSDLLASWRADRSVICFDWQATTWLPRFQFALNGGMPDPAVRVVLAELGTVFDEAETAQWFATPNSALGGLAPVGLIGDHSRVVILAARRDRFIADA